MNKFIKIVAILGIVAILPILSKNYYFEYHLMDELSSQDIKVKDIQCNGLYNIHCKLDYVEFNKSHNSTLYSFKVEEVIVENLIEIYRSYRSKDYPNNNFTIDIKNLITKDSRGAFNQISEPMDINIKANNTHFLISYKSKDITIDIDSLDKKQSQYIIGTEIKNSAMKNTLYELYKLIYLEMKQVDGEEIAKGLNISFGVPSDNYIPKGEFLANAMPRFVDLSISEIESYESFNQYNHDGALSKILEDIMTQEGKREYQVILSK